MPSFKRVKPGLRIKIVRKYGHVMALHRVYNNAVSRWENPLLIIAKLYAPYCSMNDRFHSRSDIHCQRVANNPFYIVK